MGGLGRADGDPRAGGPAPLGALGEAVDTLGQGVPHPWVPRGLSCLGVSLGTGPVSEQGLRFPPGKPERRPTNASSSRHSICWEPQSRSWATLLDPSVTPRCRGLAVPSPPLGRLRD